MIHFLCPKSDTPSGEFGSSIAWFNSLNELGIEARVAQTDPFDVYWDAHPIPKELIVRMSDLNRADTLVIPEVMFPLMGFEHARKIVFVQNRIWLTQEFDMYRPGAEVLVCSRYLANYMQREHKATVIGKVTPFLDGDVWKPTPKTANKTLVLARRNPYHAKMKAALEADGFPVEYVTEPLTQRQLAEKFDSCEFYVHLTHPEGFPMICLEAMRSGVIVAGTTGGGGNEFMFHGETARVVQDPENGHYGSADEFIRRIMVEMNWLRDHTDERSRIWQTAYAWSLRYTADETKKELVKVLDNKSISVRVNACPRCKHGHPQVNFFVLEEPVVFGLARFRYWGMCSVKNEPILARLVSEDSSTAPEFR